MGALTSDQVIAGETPASRGTETSAEVLVGPPWRICDLLTYLTPQVLLLPLLNSWAGYQPPRKSCIWVLFLYESACNKRLLLSGLPCSGDPVSISKYESGTSIQ